jgi:hypothetical protein
MIRSALRASIVLGAWSAEPFEPGCHHLARVRVIFHDESGLLFGCW